MANTHTFLLVILSITSSSLQDVTDNKVNSENENPLAGIAREILKEKNLENIGGVVNSFIQSGGAKQIVDGVLQNLASNANSGQLLESLGGLFANSEEHAGNGEVGREQTKTKDEINPMELLSSLGSIVGTMQGDAGGDGNQANPAALLQGLGAILGGARENGGGNNAAALLQGLGALMNTASQEDNKPKEDNPAGALLQGIGSILGAAANNGNQGGTDASALIQGLGSLLGRGQESGKGGLNPELIGNLVNMFANSQNEPKKAVKSGKPKAKKGNKSKPRKTSTSSSNGKKRTSGLASVVNSVLSGQNGLAGLDTNFISENFELILKMAKSLGGPESKKYLDPIEDVMHVYREVRDKEKETNFKKLLPRILRILQAYKELIAPHIKRAKESSFDLNSIVNVANSFLGQVNSAKEGSSFMDYLPMIMNTINAFSGPEADERAQSHSGHSWALPPVIEKIHIYFESFMSSDMGKQLLSYIENQKAFKVFQNKNGKFDYEKFKELIENHSFRRHWLQRISQKIVEYLRLISDEKVQKQYIDMGITFTNSYLKNSGFPKDSLLNPKQPVISITNFANFAAKKYLDADISAREYVEPTVLYIQDLLAMAKKSVAQTELTDKLTDTINMEIIEPVTRVNRAYRFAKLQPKCDMYLFCLLNQEAPSSDAGSLPGLKKVLYKGYSLVAAWFLRVDTGSSYWDLYEVITEQRNCQDYYKNSCDGFYHEEVKATTEYVHNEL
ncbi:uncharacterized protein [Euwallacea similis]|uniref:uncharacterized protein isoform X1 n=1 Tax=Euwallacea similis TaxID=1736056 RepID=UPI00344F97E6